MRRALSGVVTLIAAMEAFMAANVSFAPASTSSSWRDAPNLTAAPLTPPWRKPEIPEAHAVLEIPVWDQWDQKPGADDPAAGPEAFRDRWVASPGADGPAAGPMTALWDRWEPYPGADVPAAGPEDASAASPAAEPPRAPRPKWSLPARKVEAAHAVMAYPKQKPKPLDTAEYQREVAARSVCDRKQARPQEPDDQSAPWDTRGPRGPKDGGPTLWKKQKYREGSGRWANAGGQHREKYSLYHKKKADGLQGAALQYWHPMDLNGHWAIQAAELGVMSPHEMKKH
jgi:hypothetical protein